MKSQKINQKKSKTKFYIILIILLIAIIYFFISLCSKQKFISKSHTYEKLNVDRNDKQEFELAVSKENELPIINITTSNNNELILSREIYTDCVVDVFNTNDTYELDEISAGIRVRGNSSAYHGDIEMIKSNSVPYRIKFDEKQNMLGLNNGAKCKNWVLLKSNPELIKNDIAFRMGRAIFKDTNYVSDSQFVHLYINDNFQGIYLLCEQNQVNKNRVNISETEKNYTDTDIGYYLEIDNYAKAESDNIYFTIDYKKATVTDILGTKRQFSPIDYSIKSDIYSQDQVIFIEKYINNVFEILYRATEKNEYMAFDDNFNLVKSNYSNAKETIESVMDIDSVVNMYLLYEIVHDYDCGKGSFYMCIDFSKESNISKLQFTSPWDFDWAYNDSTDRYWAGTFCEESFANEKR